MSGKMTQWTYQDLIDQNVKWLLQQPDTLEREHIISIVKDSVNYYYPKSPQESAAKIQDNKK